MCSLWQHQQHKYVNITSEFWYANEINKLQEKWYLKLTWAKTDDILDSIPFKVFKSCSIKSAKYAFFFCLSLLGQSTNEGLRNWLWKFKDQISQCLFLNQWLCSFECFCPNIFAPFTIPQTFSVWHLISFLKIYISFVLSQYKNKAHCTYCSIGKFFCLFFS